MFDLFTGSDLKLEIKLEEGRYRVPETAHGTLVLLTEKGFAARDIKFNVSGIEATRITKRRHSMHSRHRHTAHSKRIETVTYAESFVFYSQNLLPLLQSITGIKISDEELKISPGYYRIPFEFSLPENLPQSYSGTNASIAYKVSVLADRQNRLDVTKGAVFEIVNSKSSKFADSYMLEGSGSDKTPDATLELDEDTKYDFGQKIKGRVAILKDLEGKNVKGVEIMLREVEYAQAQLAKASVVRREWKEKIDLVGDDARAVPLSFTVPEDIHPTYTGRISRLVWILEAKINIAWHSDIHAAVVINSKI